MDSNLQGVNGEAYEAAKYEKWKFLFLAVLFFFIIGSYTIIRDLKNSVFMGLVGKEYIPVSRLIVLLLLVPAILLYSKIVDKVKRYYLLSIYSIFFAIGSLVFAFFIGHPTIGIVNTDQSPYRLFGWLFYFFVEGFSPFVLSIFWAFSNSISKPKGAKKYYGWVVSASKIGGMLTAGSAWALFTFTSFPIFGAVSDVAKMRLILFIASLFLFAVPVVIKILMKIIPVQHLHGYEAVYKIEKKRGKAGKSETGIWAGLRMLLKYPYVLGIFAMTFFYELLNSILSYLRLSVAQKEAGSVAGTSAFLFKWVFIMHVIGFCISLFGTSSLLRKLGTRTCVFLIPVIMGFVVFCFVASSSAIVVMSAFTIMKAIHYAFSKPVVESLYIPTLKEIKFKSKSWIDAFGSKLAKGSGSVFNLAAGLVRPVLFLPLYSFFFAIIIGAWVFSSFFLGRRFEEAIDANEAIGSKE